MNRCLRHARHSTKGKRAAEFEKRKLCATPLKVRGFFLIHRGQAADLKREVCATLLTPGGRRPPLQQAVITQAREPWECRTPTLCSPSPARAGEGTGGEGVLVNHGLRHGPQSAAACGAMPAARRANALRQPATREKPQTLQTEVGDRLLSSFPLSRWGEGAMLGNPGVWGRPAQSCLADGMNRSLRHARAAEFEKRKLCATPLRYLAAACARRSIIPICFCPAGPLPATRPCCPSLRIHSWCTAGPSGHVRYLS